MQDDSPHFVFFYVGWSKYCGKVAPVWEQLAEKYNNMEPQMVPYVNYPNSMGILNTA